MNIDIFDILVVFSIIIIVHYMFSKMGLRYTIKMIKGIKSKEGDRP